MSIESPEKFYGARPVPTVPNLRADHPLRTGKPVAKAQAEVEMFDEAGNVSVEGAALQLARLDKKIAIPDVEIEEDGWVTLRGLMANSEAEARKTTGIDDVFVGIDLGGPDFAAVAQIKAYAEETAGAQREKLHATPYDLVPFQEITDAFSRVAEHGAVKYAPWNWSKGLKRVQLLGSLLRHAFAYLRGQDRDPDSGLLHTDHILWNAAVLSHNVHWDLEDGRRGEPYRDYHDRALKGAGMEITS